MSIHQGGSKYKNMNENKITKKVIAVLARTLEIPVSKVKTDSTQKSIESWDSLAHLKLVMEIEKNFNISFNTDEVFSMDSIEEICRLVKKHLA